jgi:chaperonin GroEL
MLPMLPILEAVVQTGKPFVIGDEDMEGEALATLVVNKLRGGLKIAAVSASRIDAPMLGRAKRVRIEKENPTIIDEASDKRDIEAPIAQIRAANFAGGARRSASAARRSSRRRKPRRPCRTL